MLIVVALGGNALLRRDEQLRSDLQQHNVAVAAEVLAELAQEHRLVVSHGNGPQIGLLALQSEACRDVRTYPLDVLGAQSEGMIGYLLEREIANALPGRDVVSLLTQTVVDALDPAFRHPTKPIGPVYTELEANRMAEGRGWTVAAEGDGWRRVVASPAPRAIVELRAIKLLVDAGVIVMCAGGGGIPVVVDVYGVRHGVEGVVDKDWAAALLARQIGADLLVLLTDVTAVELDWGRPTARPITSTTSDELRDHEFAPGSMAPKVSAACWFASTTHKPAAIGALVDAIAIVEGGAGTRITPELARRS